MPFELGPALVQAFKEYVYYTSFVVAWTWPFWVGLFLNYYYKLWKFKQMLRWGKTQSYEFIAVSVPADNEKDPKFMEQVIQGFHSIEKPFNWVEEYIEGRYQLTASLEVVSINGQVRYVIRMPSIQRGPFESHIYALYPEAEIMPVEDYTQFAPTKFPDEEWDMWGSEITLVADDAYPIKTHRDYAEEIEQGFIDPMATLIEGMSNARMGEQMWFQVVLRPRWDEKWKDKVKKIIDEQMNRDTSDPPNWFQKYILGAYHGAQRSVDQSLGWAAAEDFIQEDGGSSLVMLTPGERTALQAMEDSMGYPAFYVKMRFVYLAKNEIYNKVPAMMTVLTWARMYMDEDLNGLKPNTKNWTSVDYFKKQRLGYFKTVFMDNFKARDWYAGGNAVVLSVLEVASLYHFPYASIKTPTIERAEMRKSEAPTNLPLS